MNKTPIKSVESVMFAGNIFCYDLDSEDRITGTKRVYADAKQLDITFETESSPLSAFRNGKVVQIEDVVTSTASSLTIVAQTLSDTSFGDAVFGEAVITPSEQVTFEVTVTELDGGVDFPDGILLDTSKTYTISDDDGVIEYVEDENMFTSSSSVHFLSEADQTLATNAITIGQVLTVSGTSLETKSYDFGSVNSVTRFIRAEGINLSTGKPFVATFPKASFKTTGTFSLFSTEAQADTTLEATLLTGSAYPYPARIVKA